MAPDTAPNGDQDRVTATAAPIALSIVRTDERNLWGAQMCKLLVGESIWTAAWLDPELTDAQVAERLMPGAMHR